MSHTEIVMGSRRVAPAEYIMIEVLGRTNNAYRWGGEADVLEAHLAAHARYVERHGVGRIRDLVRHLEVFEDAVEER